MHISRNTPAFVEDARLLQEMGRWPVGGGGSDLYTRQRGVRSRPGEVDTEGFVSRSRLTGWWDGRVSPSLQGRGPLGHGTSPLVKAQLCSSGLSTDGPLPTQIISLDLYFQSSDTESLSHSHRPSGPLVGEGLTEHLVQVFRPRCIGMPWAGWW